MKQGQPAVQPTPVIEDPQYRDVVEAKEGQAADYRTAVMELVWRCDRCGLLLPRSSSLPERCPSCGAPREYFVALTED